MKPIVNLGLWCALALSIIPLQGAEPEVITRSFDVEPGGELKMRVDRGSIQVKTSAASKVEVKVVRELRGAGESKAKNTYARHKIAMTQSGSSVSIEAESQTKWSWFGNPLNRMRVQYIVTVPSKFNLDLKTAGGNIDIADLEGKVQARTAGGNLELGAIRGPIQASTAGGRIKVLGGEGNADVRTSGGDLEIGRIQGDLIARTSGGSIQLDQVKGAVDAQTSGGNIRVNEAFGPIQARTSGGNVSATMRQQPAGSCVLSTSGGNVALTLAEDLAVDLEARTNGGNVRSDFPGDMNKQRTRLTARVNGGGPQVTLETAGGNVDVRRGPKVVASGEATLR